MTTHVIRVTRNVNQCINSSLVTVIMMTTKTSAVMKNKKLEAIVGHRRRPPKWSTCLITIMLLYFLSFIQSIRAFYHQLPPVTGLEANGGRPNEYQLTGEAGQQIRLPCLIGKQLYCGEPYFIAWYKLNASSKSWVRFEHKSMEDNEVAESIKDIGSLPSTKAGPLVSQPLANRVRFDWSPRATHGLPPKQAPKSANFKSSICSDSSIFHSSPAINNPRQFQLDQANFDCAQLTISPLELHDEGQYKCEITFSESLDFDKCPATTLSQLSVIARPSGPELLVNGRKTSPSGSSNWAFKEGAQVRLECQSSGGKPAPRIEWLNVSESEERVQLMRDFWPQKRTSFLQQDNGNPVTSSSLTVSLSRFDSHSLFVCLVLPQPLRVQQQQAAAPHYSLEQLVKNPAHLIRMFKTSSLDGQQQQQSLGLMFKQIKLDVQVKPSSVSLIVRDVYSSSSLLEPVQFAELESASGPVGIPFYSLQLNRLYAIQCLVEQSRPQSQVIWFNRSIPIAVDTVELSSSSSGSSYFIVPNELTQLNSMMRPNYNNPLHRTSSFIRHELLPDGVGFRTTATLLLTTSLWDNFEELSCQISNEAFSSEELPRAAPIRLFVNYAPFAWLEPDLSRLKQPNQQQQQIDWPTGSLARVSLNSESELSLRCSVAANPLGQNTILQIEWLKDGRKIQQPSPGQVSSSSPSSKQQQASSALARSRLHIERANHLHMPPSASSGTKNGNQLALGSKLIGSSWLSIGAPLNKSDSGNYTCQFKLIPAPPSAQSLATATPATHPNQAIQSSTRLAITSGQANQTVQVNVLETKASAPTIRLSSARGVFVYWLAGSEKELPGGEAKNHQTAVLDSLDARFSLSCDMPNQVSPIQVSPLTQAGHKVLWYANNKLLQSQQPRETLDTSLRLLLANLRQSPFIITCAHQMLSSSGQSDEFHGASSMRLLESTNSIDIRLKVGPKLVDGGRESLMPKVRSFSELDLSANPTNKLHLVCLAQCEPLCSIDWYFNQDLLAPASSSAPADASGFIAPESTSRANNSSFGVAMNRFNLTFSSASQGFVQRRELLATSLPWLKMVAFENVHQNQDPAPATNQYHRNRSSRFSWSRQSSLGSTVTGHPASLYPQQQFDWFARQLMREAGEQQHLPDQVNVFSRLELSYNSIARLLEIHNKRLPDNARPELLSSFKCRVNPLLDPIFDHALIPPNQWFNVNDYAAQRHRISSNGKSNLSLLFPAAESSNLMLSSNNIGGLSFVDEMQTSIVLDGAPASVSIWFAGVQSTSLDPNGVTLSESQLIELADPNGMAPLLQCKVLGDHPQPSMKFTWTFSDWNNTQLALGELGDGSPQLNLRQLIELRQSQLNVEPMMALGLDVVLSSIVGNYTCTVSNIHGSKSATMPIRLQGRPICKLALANQFLGPENELLANLRCTSYSIPPLMETIWLRNEQRLATNKSLPIETDNPLSLASGPPLITSVDLPVMVLNKQQEFLLADLLSPRAGSFKCIARNSIGFSEACELNQANKQMVLNTLRPIGNDGLSLGGGKNPALSIVLFPDSNSKQSINLLAPSNQTNHIHMSSAANQSQIGGSIFRLNHLLRIDWLVIIVSLLAGLWLLFILSSAVARRKFKLQSTSSSNGSPGDRNHHTGWRFNSSSRSNSNNEIVGVPFQGSKVCVNYYGGSNGDSEHEMIQSGSQSSHYEDFIQHQLQLKQQQQQQQQQQQRLISHPVYLNGLSTLNRTMKSSLTSSSASDSNTNSRLGVKKLLSQTGMRPDHQAGSAAMSIVSKQNQSASGPRDSFIAAASGGGYVTNSNVPLVDGSNNSRVDLDQQQIKRHYRSRPPLRNGLEQQLYGTRNEHIYDDVIYNQMIL